MNKNNFILIISGNEILSGRRQDKHISFLTRELANVGLTCLRCVVVGDEVESFESSVEQALTDTNLIITTGGLGPTTDDLTRDALSNATGIPLQENADALQMIADRFARMNREMKDNNRLQALVPTSGGFLPNDNGTAPGLVFEMEAKTVIALPGPPRELEPMLYEQVIPYLNKRIPNRVVPIYRSFRFCGIGESNVDEVMRRHFADEPGLNISYLAGLGIVELRLSLYEDTPEAHARLDEYSHKVQRLFPEYIFSTVEESLEESIIKLLKDKGKTLAVAESCTGGMLGEKITDVSGSSQVFIGGIISYSNEIKMHMLGVHDDTLDNYGAVSRETAYEMALGIVNELQPDYGIAITGIAGPDGGTPEKPVGTVWIAVANQLGEVYPFMIQSAGDRDSIRQRSCYYALDQLRRLLLGLKVHE
jgi:nicotinamide-nucleotide amidase